MTVVRMLGGLLLALFGLWWAAIPLAFATMIDPSTPDDAWWGEYWSHLYHGGGVPMVFMGLIMMSVGVNWCWVNVATASTRANGIDLILLGKPVIIQTKSDRV